MTKQYILVVDDEPQIRRALRASFTAQGYDVIAVGTGEEALDRAAVQVPSLVILDLMMPGMNGIEVCRNFREWTNIPIIILSARGQEADKVAALDAGADDYLTKPFGMDEMLARVRAALRRQTGDRPQTEAVLTVGNFQIDFARRVVSKDEVEVKLTPIEYEVLRFLAQNADRVVTHRQLLASVWGGEYTEETQLLRVHVGHLRQKIEDNPTRPHIIITEPGVGYRFRTS